MKSLRRFAAYLKPYIKYLVIANICMLLFVLFSLLSIGLIMPFIDVLFNEAPRVPENAKTISPLDLKDYLSYHLSRFMTEYSRLDLIKILAVLMVVVFLLKNMFQYLQTYFMSIVEQGMIRDIRLALYTHFHKLSLGYFTEEKKGILISRIINDVQIIKDSIIAVINSIFRDPPLILSFTFALFLLNWKLTLLLFLLLPVTGFILAKIGDSLKRRSIRSQERIADITSILDETFGAMRIVKAFNMEEHEIKRFSEYEKKYFSLLMSLIRRRALAAPITEIIGIIVITIILYFIGSEIISGRSEMTPGSFFFYIGVFFQMLPSLKLFGQMFNSAKEGTAAAERVESVLDTKPRISDAPGAAEINSFSKSIEFRNVHFKYEKSDVILKNINLTISKGQIVAIVGPSGAGKSSLVDLIPRFYDPAEGTISIDGTDIKNIKLKSLRNLMGIVAQETILFNDTIGNNIAYGSRDMSAEEIIEAAKAANAHNFINELPDKYDTVIGDRGLKISGGERQRVAIARALLKNPPILILDEATSSLDTQSELLVQQAIERLMQGRTSVVIAHRLSTTQNASKIIVINEGEIVEKGNHNELMSLNGLYKKLYSMQFKI